MTKFFTPSLLSRIFIPLFLAIFLLPVNASGFRCGREIISEGDTKSKVIARCGSADSIVTSSIDESGSISGQSYQNRNSKYRNFEGSYSGTTVSREVWTYNCGSGDWIYQLNFEGDVLKTIGTNGRGYGYRGWQSAQDKAREKESERYDAENAQRETNNKLDNINKNVIKVCERVDKIEKKVDNLTTEVQEHRKEESAVIRSYITKDGEKVFYTE